MISLVEKKKANFVKASPYVGPHKMGLVAPHRIHACQFNPRIHVY